MAFAPFSPSGGAGLALPAPQRPGQMRPLGPAALRQGVGPAGRQTYGSPQTVGPAGQQAYVAQPPADQMHLIPHPPQPPSPLDAQYFANVGANEFKVNNDINALNLQDASGLTGLQSQLGQLQYQQPRADLRLEEAANRRGGLYSSVYDQQLGDLNQGYLSRESGAVNAFEGQHAERAGRISALRGSVPLFNEQQYQAAVTRSSNAAAKNPASRARSTGGQRPASLAAPQSGAARVAARLAQRASAAKNDVYAAVRGSKSGRGPSAHQMTRLGSAHGSSSGGAGL